MNVTAAINPAELSRPADLLETKIVCHPRGL